MAQVEYTVEELANELNDLVGLMLAPLPLPLPKPLLYQNLQRYLLSNFEPTRTGTFVFVIKSSSFFYELSANFCKYMLTQHFLCHRMKIQERGGMLFQEFTNELGETTPLVILEAAVAANCCLNQPPKNWLDGVYAFQNLTLDQILYTDGNDWEMTSSKNLTQRFRKKKINGPEKIITRKFDYFLVHYLSHELFSNKADFDALNLNINSSIMPMSPTTESPSTKRPPNPNFDSLSNSNKSTKIMEHTSPRSSMSQSNGDKITKKEMDASIPSKKFGYNYYPGNAPYLEAQSNSSPSNPISNSKSSSNSNSNPNPNPNSKLNPNLNLLQPNIPKKSNTPSPTNHPSPNSDKYDQNQLNERGRGSFFQKPFQKANRKREFLRPMDSLDQIQKGLTNLQGENNCFLNGGLQLLSHNQEFRKSFEKAIHTCKTNSCLFCQMKELFRKYKWSEVSQLPPNEIRITLSCLFSPQGKFQLNSMDDAAECLEAIFQTLHQIYLDDKVLKEKSVNVDGSEKCGPCVAHLVYGVEIAELLKCKRCLTSSKPLVYSGFIRYFPVASFFQMQEQKSKKEMLLLQKKSFGSLMKKISSETSSKCPTCKQKNKLCISLLNEPHNLIIGLNWPSNNSEGEEIRKLFSLLDPTIKTSDMFASSPNLTYNLIGIICYFGLHYISFYWNQTKKIWIMFDDVIVKEVGDLEAVASKCIKGRTQPTVLFYEKE